MRTIKPLITILGATALLTAAVVPAAAQDTEMPDLQSRVDEFVGLLPGGVVAVTIRNGVTTTAAAGIADVDGTPLGVDTPLLTGGLGAMPLYTLVLQLVEDALIDLDEPITTYLPDAPVAEAATVRDVLTARAGVPLPSVVDMEAVQADPERIFTTDDLVRSVADEETRARGDLTDGYVNTLILAQLIEAATNTDAATVLAEQVTGPLGMTATRRPDGDPEAVGEVAGGWITSAGEPLYLPNTSNASRTLRPTVTSAGDFAVYLSALVAGELVSRELLESTVFDESVEMYAYGFDRPDEAEMAALGLLGPSGTRWFGYVAGPGSLAAPHTGANTVAAFSPDTGDVVVVFANNEDLDSIALARDIVADWGSGAPTAAATVPVQGTMRFTPLLLCDAGQLSGFDLAPCDADDEGVHYELNAPFELSGTLDGIGSLDGIQTVRPDGSFGADAKAIFMGEVEGCGAGTVHFLIADAQGFYEEDGTPNYTQNTYEVVPGGTLPLSGSFEALGLQYRVNDYTSAVAFVGEFSCADA